MVAGRSPRFVMFGVGDLFDDGPRARDTRPYQRFYGTTVTTVPSLTWL
jgi:hypothetical protein